MLVAEVAGEVGEGGAFEELGDAAEFVTGGFDLEVVGADVESVPGIIGESNGMDAVLARDTVRTEEQHPPARGGRRVVEVVGKQIAQQYEREVEVACDGKQSGKVHYGKARVLPFCGLDGKRESLEELGDV